MGRKKKTQVDTTKPTNIDINSNIITYEGNVKVQYIKKGKVLKTISKHNTATANFFNFVCNCFAKDKTTYLNNYSNRPYRILPFYIDSSDPSHPLKKCTDGLLIINDVLIDELNLGVSFRALITSNRILSGVTQIDGIVVYPYKITSSDNVDLNSSDYQLRVNLDTPLDLSKLSGVDILITWSLKFTNK